MFGGRAYLDVLDHKVWQHGGERHQQHQQPEYGPVEDLLGDAIEVP
jgi:hypothetical protein